MSDHAKGQTTRARDERSAEHDVPFRMVIDYTPGNGPNSGFNVTLSTTGESRTCPDAFATLRAAFRRGEEVLKRAGYVTVMPSWQHGEVKL
jgi:hypothetical protein